MDDKFVQLNTTAGVRNAADKLRMKKCFQEAKVLTAEWADHENYKKLKLPIVAKHRLGSRGTGVYLLKTAEELKHFVDSRPGRLDDYIFEKFRPYNREYRLHVWEDGCFYTCRKARKRGLPEDQKWKFNYEHTVWLREDNKDFKKPECWEEMVRECVKAVKAVGLHFGGCDVKVNKEGTKFFILEINSAPSFGNLTSEKYIEMLPLMAEREYRKQKL